MQLFGASLATTVSLTLYANRELRHGHPGIVTAWLLAIVCAIPVVAILAVIGRYLARETDEFVRMLVVRAVLWGLGITLVVDTILGAMEAYHPLGGLLPALNVDLFIIAVGLALRVQLWRNR
jgi:hypothetical protein